MANTKSTVPVSARALMQRINRALEGRQELVKKAKGAKAKQELGEYFVIDYNRNFVVSKDVDLGELGRKLGSLKPYERLI